MLTANKTQKRDEVLQQITKQSVVGNKKKKKKRGPFLKRKEITNLHVLAKYRYQQGKEV